MNRSTLQRLVKWAGLVGLVNLGAGVSPSWSADQAVARPGEIVVNISPTATVADAQRIAAKAGCSVVRPIAYAPGYFLFSVDGLTTDGPSIVPTKRIMDAVIDVSRVAGVLGVSPNFVAKRLQTLPPGPKFTPNDASAPGLWGLNMIRMPEAWNIQTGVRTVRVGVVDSGVDGTHEDFKTSLGGSRVVESGHFVNDGSTNPDGDHGTHVAGTIAATSNNGVGVASVGGLGRNNVNIEIVSSRVFGSSAESGTVEAIVAGLGFAQDKGCLVVNMSLGFGPGSANVPTIRTPMENKINDLVRGGMVVIAAAGNDGSDNTINPLLPADIPAVISVSAIDSKGTLAGFSNFGGNPSRISAPGVGIRSTLNGSRYGEQDGTSMAAPHVAGVAALMMAAGAKGSDIYPALARTAATPPSGRDFLKYGAGIVDAYSALFGFTDPDPAFGMAGGSGKDLGSTYFQRFPVYMTVSGVSKIVAGAATGVQVPLSSIRVEIRPIGRNSSPVRVFVAGRGGSGDFDIPSLAPGDPKGKEFVVKIPRDNVPYRLGAGQYKISLMVGSVEKAVQFARVSTYTIPKGRSLFALPFRTDAITGSPESKILGGNPTFALARYNPSRLASQQDYERFQSSGPVNPLAMFRLGGPVVTSSILEPNVSVAPVGVGYWIDLDRNTTIDTSMLPESSGVAGSSVVPSNVAIKLFATNGGWNMIGTPFTTGVDWSSCSVVVNGASLSLEDAVNAGVIMRASIGYRNGDYVYGIAPAGRLEPFQGYWVRVFQDCTLIVPPGDFDSRSNRPGSGNLPSYARIGLIVAGERDSNNFFGVARNAATEVGREDIPKPPSAGTKAYLRFIADDQSGRVQNLAMDLRKDGVRSTEWTFAASSTVEGVEARLNWDGLKNLGSDRRIVLTDVATGTKVDMSRAGSYSFSTGEPGSSRMFKISLMPASVRGSLTISALRFTGRGTGAYSLALTTNRDANVQAVVETLAGRPVAVFAGSGRSVGLQETVLRWDGRSGSGGGVPAGAYRVRVSASTPEGETSIVQRLIQVVR